MEEFKNMTKKQQILIGIGVVILLVSDISMTGKVVIVAGSVAYFLLKKQLLKNNAIENTKEIGGTLQIPIIQIIAAYFLYEVSADAISTVGKIDSLHNISTYTPYLGDLGKGLDIANQLGVLPDIERSQGTLECIGAAGMLNNVVSIGVILIIALAMAELYGVFRLGKFTKKQMLMFYGGASMAFVICSIYFGIYLEKFMVVLSPIFSGVDEYPFTFIFPILILGLVCIFYKIYSKALERLF